MDKWKGIQSTERHLLSTGKVQTETQYYISSLVVLPKNLAEVIRGYWEIEGSLRPINKSRCMLLPYCPIGVIVDISAWFRSTEQFLWDLDFELGAHS